MIDEQRTLGFVVPAGRDDAWVLTFETTMTNVSSADLTIGSPTTRGRENAGYGGLFWRGPRSFTGGTLLAPDFSGGEEARGTRGPWMGFVGRHDGTGGASTVVIVDGTDNPSHPPQWFARTEQFGCLNPAPFFSTEVPFAPGDTLRFRYAVVIADGASDPTSAAALAALGRSRSRYEHDRPVDPRVAPERDARPMSGLPGGVSISHLRVYDWPASDGVGRAGQRVAAPARRVVGGVRRPRRHRLRPHPRPVGVRGPPAAPRVDRDVRARRRAPRRERR